MPRSRLAWLSWIVAIAFILGTVLQYVDRLNLVATPPDLPDANMVDRTLALSAYFHAIWPVFLWTNLAFGIGFIAAVAFAFNVASAARVTGGLPTFKGLATAGGVMAAIASIIPIGGAEAKVFTQYCDCGFKDTEIVSQLWAQMVTEDIGVWLTRVAGIALAIALVSLIQEAGALLSSSLRTWTYLVVVALVLAPLLGIVQLTDPIAEELTNTLTGLVLVPVWAVWLGRALQSQAPPVAASA